MCICHLAFCVVGSGIIDAFSVRRRLSLLSLLIVFAYAYVFAIVVCPSGCDVRKEASRMDGGQAVLMTSD